MCLSETTYTVIEYIYNFICVLWGSIMMVLYQLKTLGGVQLCVIIKKLNF